MQPAASIDVDNLAGDEVTAEEEDDGLGDVTRTAMALEWKPIGVSLKITRVLPGWRKDQPGCNGIDGHVRR